MTLIDRITVAAGLSAMLAGLLIMDAIMKGITA